MNLICDQLSRPMKIFSATDILRKEGWGSLWFQIKLALKQALRSYEKVEEITEEELKDGRTRLMVVIPTMEMGGAERCASVLLNRLNRTKIKTELVTIFDRKAFYPTPGDVNTYILEKLRPVKSPASSFALPSHLQRFAGDLAYLEMTASRLVHVIIRRRPSIILAQDFYASFITLLAKNQIPKTTKILVSTHSSFPSGLFSTDNSGGLYAFLLRTLFNDADRVIVVSKNAAKELEASFDVQSEKIITLYNPLDLTEALHLAEEKIEHPWFNDDIPLLLFVGRLASYKGLHHLFKAISKVRGTVKLRCVLIGEGEEKNNLRKMTEEFGITEDVLFLGKQQNPFKFMKKAAIFVLPSLTEGLPYVLVEALACGCPVIATDSPGGGPAEILKNGEYGLLIPPGDEEALSEAIIRLLQDNGLRNRFAGTAVERAKDFDLDKTVKAYEDIILAK